MTQHFNERSLGTAGREMAEIYRFWPGGKRIEGNYLRQEGGYSRGMLVQMQVYVIALPNACLQSPPAVRCNRLKKGFLLAL